VIDHQIRPDEPDAGSIHESRTTFTIKQSIAPTTANPISTDDEDTLQIAAKATSRGFSPSVVSDLDQPLLLSPQWLPLRASVKRGLLAAEELSEIDARLLRAVEVNSLDEIAMALDAGADINAAKPGIDETALQIATRTNRCSAVLLFLHYQNVNVHVRDKLGGNLLHSALMSGCAACIQGLLDVGLSMTVKNDSGSSAFNLAVQHCVITAPLLTLLKHAVLNNVPSCPCDVRNLEPDALYWLCCYEPTRRAHALILVSFEWSLGHISKYASTPFELIMLRKMEWLLEEIIRHPKTGREVVAGYAMWDKVLLAVTRPPVMHCKAVLELLLSGIEYKHIKDEIDAFAVKRKNQHLLVFLALEERGQDLSQLRIFFQIAPFPGPELDLARNPLSEHVDSR
jgi:hypothetical protein